MSSVPQLDSLINNYIKLYGKASDKNSRVNTWLNRRVAKKELLIDTTPGEELWPKPEPGILLFRVRILEKLHDSNKITRISFTEPNIGMLLNKVVLYQETFWIITAHSKDNLKLLPIFNDETHGTLRSLKKLEFSIFGFVNSNDFNRQFIEYLDGKVFSLNEEYYLFSTGQYGEDEILVILQKI